MNKLRYPDKKILCKYDLSEEFFLELGIEVEEIIPLRKVFILTLHNGKKILKIVNSDEKRLEFIDNALSYVSKEYKNILSYYKNKDGKIYKLWNGNMYVLLDMVDGREVAFTNPVEISMCAEAIAMMHKASIGILDNISNNLLKENIGKKLPEYFEESYNELKLLKSYVSKFKYKNEFDELFLSNVDYNIKSIEQAKLILALSNYNIILEDKSKKVLCHNDLAHHNFIIDGEVVKIIDFDYCNIDTRVIDIANYSLKVIKNFAYDIDKFKIIIDSYNNIEKLNKDEIKILFSLMSFPRDFVTMVKDYYYKQKAWDQDVFLNRFKNKILNEIYREEFLKNFIESFKEYFY